VQWTVQHLLQPWRSDLQLQEQLQGGFGLGLPHLLFWGLWRGCISTACFVLC
jgi:hypothetical protein